MTNEMIRYRWNNAFNNWIQSNLKDNFNPSWFFGVHGNIFTEDYERTRGVLIKEMYKYFDVLDYLKSNNNDGNINIDRFMSKQTKNWRSFDVDAKREFIKGFMSETEQKLEYLLYCAYVVELKTNVGFFQYAPPFNGKLLQKALDIRIKYFQNYKKLFEYQTKAIEQLSLFVSEETTLKNIIENNFGNAMRSNCNFLIDARTQHELLTNVKKYPLLNCSHRRESQNHIYNFRYYIGQYRGQNVLFVETVKEIRQQSSQNHLETGVEENNEKNLNHERPGIGYQLSVVLNGNIKNARLLYRLDANPNANHINKLNGDGRPNNSETENVDVDELRHKNIQPCHIHNPSNRYCVLFPNYTHSSEATESQMIFTSVEELIKFNHKYLNFDLSKTLIAPEVQKRLVDTDNAKRIRLNKYLETKEMALNE